MRLHHFVKPLLCSLGTFLLAALTIGAVVLPPEINKIRSPEAVEIHQLVADRQSDYAFLIYRCAPVSGAGIKYKLGTRNLNDPLLSPIVEFTDASPNCLLASGRQVFVGEFSGAIRSYELAPGFPSELLGTQSNDAVVGLAASGDGRLLLSWGESLYVWDVTTRSLLRKLPFHSHFAWVTTGSKSYLCDEPAAGEIVERSLESGAILRTLVKNTHLAVAAVSPDASQLAWIDTAGVLSSLNLVSGKAKWQQDANTDDVLRPLLVFSSDGSRVLSGHQPRPSGVVLNIWSAQTGELQQSLHTGMERIAAAAFSGSDQLYAWSPDGQLQEWDLRRDTAAPIATWKTTDWQTGP